MSGLKKMRPAHRHLSKAVPRFRVTPVQLYIAHKTPPPPRTLLQAYSWGSRGVLGEWTFSYGRGTPAQLAAAARVPPALWVSELLELLEL